MIAKTPQPPYYAVIFTSIKKEVQDDYVLTAEKMLRLAEKQPGFLGAESARNEVGITVSYWENLAAIKAWKANSEHLLAQQKGKTEYYKSYKVRVAKVERVYEFEM